VVETTVASGAPVHTDEDGDGFREVRVNTPEGPWSRLRSWLRLRRGVSQGKLPA
jgi:transposase